MSQLQPAASALQLMKWSVLEKIHCLVMQTAAVTSTVVLVCYWAAFAGSSITGSTQSASVLMNPVRGETNFHILATCSYTWLAHWNVACVVTDCTRPSMHVETIHACTLRPRPTVIFCKISSPYVQKWSCICLRQGLNSGLRTFAGPYPDDYLKHAANAPIMLLDVWFSKIPFASYHLQVSHLTLPPAV